MSEPFKSVFTEIHDVVFSVYDSSFAKVYLTVLILWDEMGVIDLFELSSFSITVLIRKSCTIIGRISIIM